MNALGGNVHAAYDDNPLAPQRPHFGAKAKRVIYLHMSGAPPHLDLFDYKPELVKRDSEDCPQSVLEGRRFAFTTGVPKLMGTPRKFAQYGGAGMWMSDVKFTGTGSGHFKKSLFPRCGQGLSERRILNVV